MHVNSVTEAVRSSYILHLYVLDVCGGKLSRLGLINVKSSEILLNYVDLIIQAGMNNCWSFHQLRVHVQSESD